MPETSLSPTFGEAQLVHFNRARLALAEASRIDEVKLIRDQAEALRQYIRQQGATLEMQNQCAEIKLRAERKAGEMLAESDKNEGGRPPGNLSHDVTGFLPTLKELGITHMQSSRWQLEATIPEAVFEQQVIDTKAKLEELTSGAMLKLAEKLKHLEVASLPIPPLPEGVYSVIYADPPWPYDNQIDSWGSTSLHYESISMDRLKEIQVPAAENAVLFLWVTNPFLQEGLNLAEAWGFAYKSNIVWVKTELQRPGVGFYVRGRHELLFICARGSFVPDQTGRAPIGSVLEAPVQEHSRKPDKVYDLIESIYPDECYLELFARGEARKGWKAWGHEARR